MYFEVKGDFMEEANKILIETTLYKRIKLIVESQYELEGVINPNKKDSTKIIFKDRDKAISMVKEAILEFAEENNLEISDVTNYLMEIIDLEMKVKPLFENEFKEMKDMALVKDDDGER